MECVQDRPVSLAIGRRRALQISQCGHDGSLGPTNKTDQSVCNTRRLVCHPIPCLSTSFFKTCRSFANVEFYSFVLCLLDDCAGFLQVA
jgi:hypothetical protein